MTRVCRFCGDEIRRSYVGWVCVLPREQGGTFDHCVGSLDRSHHVAPITRSAAQRVADREAILAQVGTDWVRLSPEWNTSDIAALVKDGKLEREVRKEWDRQPGTANLFGGAGTCIRHRAYVRLVQA